MRKEVDKAIIRMINESQTDSMIQEIEKEQEVWLLELDQVETQGEEVEGHC